MTSTEAVRSAYDLIAGIDRGIDEKRGVRRGRRVAIPDGRRLSRDVLVDVRRRRLASCENKQHDGQRPCQRRAEGGHALSRLP